MLGIMLEEDNPFTEYRQKTVASQNKLKKFFGTAVPLDVSLDAINHEGLRAILQSRIPLTFFLYSLLEEHSFENLFFLLEVEHYLNYNFKSKSKKLSAASHIANTYLNPNSHFEINVTEKVRKEVVSQIESIRSSLKVRKQGIKGSKGSNTSSDSSDFNSPLDFTEEELLENYSANLDSIFNGSRREILELVEVSFVKFRKSNLFTNVMMKEIGRSTNTYTSHGRALALDYLLLHLSKYPCQKVSKNKQPSKTETRILLIKHMVKEFSNSMLGLDFNQDMIDSAGTKDILNRSRRESEDEVVGCPDIHKSESFGSGFFGAMKKMGSGKGKEERLV